MKLCRKIPMCLLLTVALLSLAACGSERPEATTVYVDKEGNLRQILVDSQPEYSVSDLEAYTEDSITAYLKANEGASIELESCEEADGVLYLELSYGSAEDYSGFNSMDCYLGTLEEASAAGMIGDTLLDADGLEMDTAALLAEHPDCRLLVLSEHTRVQTETAILCGSSLVAITGENTAQIGDGDAGTSGYFPRKTDAAAYLVFEGE